MYITKIIKPIYRFYLSLYKKITAYFQTKQASYKKHHRQYSSLTALEEHIISYKKYQKEDFFNHPENKFGILLKQHPEVRNVAIDIGCGAG